MKKMTLLWWFLFIDLGDYPLKPCWELTNGEKNNNLVPEYWVQC
jgi:hypothetical protein